MTVDELLLSITQKRKRIESPYTTACNINLEQFQYIISLAGREGQLLKPWGNGLFVTSSHWDYPVLVSPAMIWVLKFEHGLHLDYLDRAKRSHEWYMGVMGIAFGTNKNSVIHGVLSHINYAPAQLCNWQAHLAPIESYTKELKEVYKDPSLCKRCCKSALNYLERIAVERNRPKWELDLIYATPETVKGLLAKYGEESCYKIEIPPLTSYGLFSAYEDQPIVEV